MHFEEFQKEILQRFEDLQRIYRESKTDYDKGKLEGLKEALELIEKHSSRSGT